MRKKNVYGKHFVSKNSKSLENNLIFKPRPFSKKKKKMEKLPTVHVSYKNVHWTKILTLNADNERNQIKKYIQVNRISAKLQLKYTCILLITILFPVI